MDYSRPSVAGRGSHRNRPSCAAALLDDSGQQNLRALLLAVGDCRKDSVAETVSGRSPSSRSASRSAAAAADTLPPAAFPTANHAASSALASCSGLTGQIRMALY